VKNLRLLLAVVCLVLVAMPVHAGHLFTQGTANTPIALTAGQGITTTADSFEASNSAGQILLYFTNPTWDSGDAIKITIGAYQQTFVYDSPLAGMTQSGTSLTVNDPSLAALNLDLTAPFDWVFEAVSGAFTVEGFRIDTGNEKLHGVGAATIDQSQVVSTGKNVDEDTTLTFSTDDFKDNTNTVISKIKITVLEDPAKGALKVSGVDVILNQEVVSTDYVNMTYTPVPDFNGSTSFDWQGFISGGYAAASTLNIIVDNVNDEPAITSVNNASVAENLTAAIDVNADDIDVDDAIDTLTFTLSGTDSGLFDIVAATGVVTFKLAPDFEAPQDAGGDRIYDFTVTVTDDGVGLLNDSQNIAITVTNVIDDTDADGVTDDQEVIDGTDHTDATDYKDSDNDGVPDDVEAGAGTSPSDRRDYDDSDLDGVPDYLDDDGAIDDDSGNGVINYYIQYPLAFACDGDVFHSRGKNVFRVDTNVQPFIYTQINPNAAGIKINAIGFNYVDGYLYAMSHNKGAEKNHLIRIDASGNMTDLGAVTGLPNQGYARGDFNISGKFYTGDKTHIYEVDVTTVAVTDTIAVKPNAGIDFALNSRDNKLYSVNRKTMKITDIAGRKSISRKVKGFPADAGTFGSHWFDSAGRLYVAANTTEEVYRIDDVSNPVASYVGRGTYNGSPFDATACVGSPVVTHTISPAKISAAATVTYSYTIDNGLASGDASGDPLITGLQDVLTDGRLFIDNTLTINGAANIPNENAYGGGPTLDVSNIQVPSNGTVTITIDVDVPTLAAGFYYNQANLTGIPLGLGGDSSGELLSDFPGGAKPNPTPMEFVAPANHIEGFVFNDFDGDSVQDAGEPGVRSVVVKLSGDASATVLTDVNGYYKFAYLDDGNYTVTETNNRGYNNISVDSVVVTGLSGETTETVNFADVNGYGAVVGSVFEDLDNDGLQSANEASLGGVGIELLNSVGVSQGAATTDSAGEYEFQDLIPGLYWLRETDLGTHNSLSNNLLSSHVVTGKENTVNFTDITKASITGVVFNDFNGNGRKDVTEGVLSAVTIELKDSTGAVLDTQLSDSNGLYVFISVAAGAYVVEETDPVGYTSTTSNTQPVSIAINGVSVINFGNQEEATISGVVFTDDNGDGEQGVDENGLQNVVIYLGGGSSVTSDANGEYQFTAVAAGTYSISINDPSGYQATNVHTVTVVAEGAGSANFALVIPGVIAGSLFADQDGDNIRDRSESGLSGVWVSLTDSSNNTSYTTSNDSGEYGFDSLSAGSYTVAFSVPSGYVADSNSVAVNLPANKSIQESFALRVAGTVGGSVYNDFNGNDIRDAGEPGLGGVTVALSGNGSTTTGADGSYTFAFIPDGDYTVTETDPTGFSSAVNTANVTVTSDAVIADFGDVMEGTVSGSVYNDINGNNTVNVGEPGVGGLTVTLIDSVAGTKTYTTATEGTFLFFGVSADNYDLDVSLTTDYVSVNGTTTSFTLAVAGNVGHSFAIQQKFTPVAAADAYTVVEGSSLDVAVAGGVLRNDSDQNNDTLSAILTGVPSNGSLTLNANGSFTYIHDGSETTSDSFRYKSNDSHEDSNTVTVAIIVLPENDAPQADSQILSVLEDTGLAIALTGHDIEGDSLTYRLTVAPANGSITSSGAQWFYTPFGHFNGLDSFSFVSHDGELDSLPATVTITVTPSNDQPLANSIELVTAEDTALPITLIGSDVEGTILSYSVTSMPQHGNLTGVAPDLVYTPMDDFNGVVSFTYTTNDGVLDSSVATVIIDVSPVNDVPLANGQQLTTLEDSPIAIILTASDIDGDSLNYSVTAAPANGSLVGSGADLLYTPVGGFSGSDSFTFIASDGINISGAASVTITVLSSNTAPEVEDKEVTTPIDQSIAIDVIAGATDTDGDPLLVTAATTDLGAVELVNGEVVYTPDPGFSGTAVVEYVISDGQGGFAKAKVQVHVEGDGDEPVLTVPETVFVDATALYTKVDLGVAVAVDRFGNSLPVSLVDGITFFEPGINFALWETFDDEGRRRVEVQEVHVRPMISIEKDQTILEGKAITVGVYLNGLSPSYPLEIPFSVAGSADASDHDLIDGVIVIESGVEATINIEIYADEETEEGETVTITLGDSVNHSENYLYTLTITEGNIAPEVEVSVEQDGETRFLISQDGDLVTLSSQLSDLNEEDEHSYSWTVITGIAADQDGDDDSFTLDPSQMEPGIYEIEVVVSDNATPAKTDRVVVYLEVVETLAELDPSLDSDGDLIPDALEGYGDGDGDGVPDYLDSRDACNVLPEQALEQDAFMVEGEPGVCLRRGYFTVGGVTGGAQLSEEDIAANPDIPEETEATNIGGVFDFIAMGLPIHGQSYSIVLPQRKLIPANAIYRKYDSVGNWYTLVEDANNTLASAQGEFGFCPPPNDLSWEPGLVEGYWCVQLTIQDGGPYDDDGVANGTIVDPGGVAVMAAVINNPVALDDSLEFITGGTGVVDVLNNDSDVDGDALTVITASASIGDVIIGAGGQLSYTAKPGFVGVDTIVYSISDGAGGSDTAEVLVVVLSEPVVEDEIEEVNVTSGGGGAVGWPMFLILSLGLLIRNRGNLRIC